MNSETNHQIAHAGEEDNAVVILNPDGTKIIPAAPESGAAGPPAKIKPREERKVHSGLHDSPVEIARNRFKYKSLSSWAVNPFLGCCHGCSFCYVPDTSANKQRLLLGAYGDFDPVADWGDYVLVRPWDEVAFMASLRKAENTPLADLNADGNRAVMFSSTTDPYQTILNPDPGKANLLNTLARANMRRSLELILERSTLNVRILTRSPLAREDFDLFKRFGNRLVLGVSLPTMDSQLSELYEPHAPHPKQRLKLLQDAHAEGIPTFVAVAPVFPECGYDGMLEVFNAVKEVGPVTLFMEPVNIRLGVAERIKKQAEELNEAAKESGNPGKFLDVDITPFKDSKAWSDYAIRTLLDAERVADAAGVRDRLHLWPDHDDLGAAAVVEAQSKVWSHPSGMNYMQWLESNWNRVSNWPGKTAV